MSVQTGLLEVEVEVLLQILYPCFSVPEFLTLLLDLCYSAFFAGVCSSSRHTCPYQDSLYAKT